MEPPATKRRRLLDPLPPTGNPGPTQGQPHGLLQSATLTPPPTAPSEDLDDIELPSDLEAAITLLRNEFSAQDGSGKLPPIVLKSQLYTVLKDRTDSDRDLDDLRRRNIIRLFKLATGIDDYAILLTPDYLKAIRQAAQPPIQPAAPSQPKSPPQHPQRLSPQQHAAETFITNVLQHLQDITITHTLLMQLLMKPPDPKTSRPALATTATTPSMPLDQQISLLLNMNCLSRHTDDMNAYCLCVPGIGPVVKSISSGRRELVGWLQRKKYQEAPEKLVNKVKLRHSVLGVHFHVRDLLGQGQLNRLQTTTGSVLRLVKHK